MSTLKFSLLIAVYSYGSSRENISLEISCNWAIKRVALSFQVHPLTCHVSFWLIITILVFSTLVN